MAESSTERRCAGQPLELTDFSLENMLTNSPGLRVSSDVLLTLQGR